jgi:hypothetical protein
METISGGDRDNEKRERERERERERKKIAMGSSVY